MFFIAIFALLLQLVTTTMAPHKIVLIRHAEKSKDKGDNGLSKAGKERAKMLVGCFRDQSNHFGEIGAIYAAKPSKPGSSERPEKTVKHVAKDWGLDINLHYKREPKEDAENPQFIHGVRTPKESPQTEMAREILGESFHGKTVLISWEHKALGNLIVSLGGPDIGEWGDVFDRTFVLNYHNDHFHSYEDLRQPPLL